MIKIELDKDQRGTIMYSIYINRMLELYVVYYRNEWHSRHSDCAMVNQLACFNNPKFYML